MIPTVDAPKPGQDPCSRELSRDNMLRVAQHMASMAGSSLLGRVLLRVCYLTVCERELGEKVILLFFFSLLIGQFRTLTIVL